MRHLPTIAAGILVAAMGPAAFFVLHAAAMLRLLVGAWIRST